MFPFVGCKADDDSDTPRPTYYTVTVTSSEHGTVTADPTSATEGTTVTLTIAPETGYQLKTITATTAAGADVTLTPDNNDSTKYKFTMPESNVTVTATFESQLLAVPLTLEAIADGAISVENPWTTLKYTKNDGPLTAYSVEISVAANDIICFYAESSESDDISMKISCTADCYLYGNIMSLVTLEADATDASQWNPEATSITTNKAFGYLFYDNTHIKNHASKKLCLPATTLAESCYADMFYGCTGLTSAPDLPATSLARDCYQLMFDGCTNLTSAPELPATSLAQGCYQLMFYGCIKLTSAPDLPATTLADYCYYNMFYGCKSLTRAPDLPATTLTNNCYYCMFCDCTSLNYIKCLATDISAYKCTYFWVEDVASSGTFVKAASADWSVKTGNDGIPSGWTVQEE